MKQFSNRLSSVWLSALAYQFVTIFLILLFCIDYFFSSGFIISRLIVIIYLIFRIYNKYQWPEKYVRLSDTLLIYFLLSYFYGETGLLNTFLFPKFDPVLVKIDEYLFGFQPSVWFSETFSHPVFSEIMFMGYFSYYLMPFFAFIIIWKKKPLFFEEFSFIILSGYFVYYLIFIVLPAEGPQFYFSGTLNQIQGHGPFAWMVKTIQLNAEAPTAAFPSSHIGITLMMLALLFKRLRPLFWIFLPFGLILCFSTVYIKAHYFIDVLGGLISAPIIFLFCKFIFLKISHLKNKHIHGN